MVQQVETISHETEAHETHHEMSFWEKYIFSVDHKIIGLQYLFTGLFMAAIGGYFAYAFRMQLAWPGEAVPLFGYVDPAKFNMLVTNHGTIMIFVVHFFIIVVCANSHFVWTFFNWFIFLVVFNSTSFPVSHHNFCNFSISFITFYSERNNDFVMRVWSSSVNIFSRH